MQASTWGELLPDKKMFAQVKFETKSKGQHDQVNERGTEPLVWGLVVFVHLFDAAMWRS